MKLPPGECADLPVRWNCQNLVSQCNVQFSYKDVAGPMSLFCPLSCGRCPKSAPGPEPAPEPLMVPTPTPAAVTVFTFFGVGAVGTLVLSIVAFSIVMGAVCVVKYQVPLVRWAYRYESQQQPVELNLEMVPSQLNFLTSNRQSDQDPAAQSTGSNLWCVSGRQWPPLPCMHGLESWPPAGCETSTLIPSAAQGGKI